jgi:hypothetical protein
MPRDERLLIENFGPIHTADLAIRDLTVFVGPQASGKSLAAQLLYYMRGMEELLPGPAIQDELDVEEQAVPVAKRSPEQEALSYWLGGSIRRFVATAENPESVIRWWPKQAPGDTSNRLQLVRSHTIADMRVPSISATYQKHARGSREHQIYIPAGRTLFSMVSPSTALQLISQKKIDWPGFIVLFYKKLSDIIEAFSVGRRTIIQNDYIGTKLVEALRCRLVFMDDKVRLALESNPNQSRGRLLLDPLRAASGQMETWPFVAVVQEALAMPKAQRRIFFEEPEAHLHPTAQRALLDVVAALTNRKQRFVLTTHSPYVIYAINNYLLARQVLDKGRTLPSPELEQTALRPDQVAAYRFTTDGQVESLFDEETGLLKTSELDDPAAALSATFSELQDALFEDDK